jgi:carbohydrate-selective porin OprB
VLVKGGRWKRDNDSFGAAGYVNGLSPEHRQYLAAGGQGFFLGDGQLSYGQEKILEVFYSMGMVRGTWLTANFQHVQNPGYNRDRGPAEVYGLRLHAEF